MEISQASDGSPYEKHVDAKGHVLSDRCIAGEVPFGELPEGWVWARLETVYNFIDYRGKTPHKSPSGVRLMTASNIRQGYIDYTRKEYISEDEYATRLSRGETHRGDLLFTTEAPMGYCAICEMKRCSCGQRVITLQNYGAVGPDNALFCQIILSPLFQVQVKEHATGTTAKGIKAAVLKELFLPIPPLAEQRRIVERVNQLMPLVEEYGDLEDAREELDVALPGRLRKSVLQMAVQGKLAPQDPTDEPACKLLKRIRDQRRELVAEKKMKAPKGGESVIFTGSDGRRYEKRIDAKGRESEPVCIEDEIPFDIPDSWEWARLESICDLLRGSGIKRADVAADGFPCVRYGELYTTYATSIIDVASYTSKEVFDASKKLEPDEVLITLTGENNIDIGRAVFNVSGSVLAFGGDLLALKGRRVRGDYLTLAINSGVVGSQRTEASTGNIIVHLSASKASRFLIPLPPLAEQSRIVKQFETLQSIIA